MKLSIIIPNYNGRYLLEKNLPMIISESEGSEIINVDDRSTDDSVSFIRKNYPIIKVITKQKNDGFASTVNSGVSQAKGELVYLLNSDVVPQKGFIRPLVNHFRNQDVFAVGSLQYVSIGDSQNMQGRGIGSFRKGFLCHGRGDPISYSTLWVFGGAGMFRKSIWMKLGGMYDIYNPFYWEDIDISYRALKAGYKVIFERKSQVLHPKTDSSIISHYSQKRIKLISYRNQILFVWLNISDKYYCIEHIFYLFINLFKSLFKFDLLFVKALFMALLKFGSVIRYRRKNRLLFKINDKRVLTGLAS